MNRSNFRTNFLNNLGFQAPQHKKYDQLLFKQQIDLSLVSNLIFKSGLPHKLRGLVWQLYLNVLPVYVGAHEFCQEAVRTEFETITATAQHFETEKQAFLSLQQCVVSDVEATSSAEVVERINDLAFLCYFVQTLCRLDYRVVSGLTRFTERQLMAVASSVVHSLHAEPLHTCFAVCNAMLQERTPLLAQLDDTARLPLRLLQPLEAAEPRLYAHLCDIGATNIVYELTESWFRLWFCCVFPVDQVGAVHDRLLANPAFGFSLVVAIIVCTKSKIENSMDTESVRANMLGGAARYACDAEKAILAASAIHDKQQQ